MANLSKGFIENRKPARIALVACVAFAIIVMAPVKLSNMRANALRVFKSGTTEGVTLSLQGDLETAAVNADMLANSAAASLGEDDAGVLELKALSKTILENRDEPGVMLKAFSSLPGKADAIYLRLEASSLSETVLRDALAQYQRIKTADSTIRKDAYFTYADEFNEARSGFPAKLLAWINGIDELGTGR